VYKYLGIRACQHDFTPFLSSTSSAHMATAQHYLWAGGHFILLVSALRYFLAIVTLKAISSWWYKVSFTGALISYVIVCQKSLGLPQPNAAWFKRALVDENVQYFLLASFWWSSKPVAIALLPYTIFSLFHALTFTRTTIIPHILPPGPPAAAGGPPQAHPVAKKLQMWVKANYDTAMKAVAYTELLIMARIFLGAITFQNSLLSPIIYAHFLRQRYYHSAFTRDAIAVVDKSIEGYVRKEGVPPIAVQTWDKVRAVLGRWTGSTLVPQQPPAGAGGARRN
jgi:hypothetical protein